MSTPFAAMLKSGHLRRVDAALGEWIVRAFPDTPADVALAAALAARAVTAGHSALALDRAQAWLGSLAESRPARLPDVATWLETLRQSQAVCASDEQLPDTPVPLILDAQGRVYLRRYFGYERGLARSLIARANTSPSADGDVPRTRSNNPANIALESAAALDPEQQRAVATALTHRFTLVTGGPGTGKTFVVARILAALAGRAPAGSATLRIALAAPTGKAAARLAASIRAQLGNLELPEAVATQVPQTTGTLHRLLGLSPARTQPRFDHATPLPFDVVVVDEVSMVDLPLMAKLAEAVPGDARLILLGDPDQLAAVEAGDVLGALVEAATGGPLQGCHVALERNHRFGAHSVLAALADALKHGDADAALRVPGQSGEVSLAGDARSMQLVEAAGGAYQHVARAGDPADALRAARAFRVLTALRHGPSGCIAIDRAIAAHLQRVAGVRADERWWRGRLVMVTANRPELGLYNGDTGVIWPGADGTLKAWFDGDDGAPWALPVSALPPYEGAFALTVHKAQGSEFDHIALVTGPDSAVLTRELLYTGVTRARAGVTLYTTPEILRAGIARRTLRMTGLADRLREAAGT